MKTASLLLAAIMSCSVLSQAQPHFQKVVMVVFENTDYKEAMTSDVLKKIAAQGAMFTGFSGEAHPSQGNYIAMVAGSSLGVKDDKNVDLKDSHIGDLLEAKSMDWHLYAEDFPGNCFTGATAGKYARKHVPFISFLNVTSNPQRCAKITNFDRLFSDIESNHLAEFNLVVPNLMNDGHDSGLPGIENWVTQKLMPLLNNAQTLGSTLFIITFDESDTKSNNQIFTAAVGAGIRPGTVVSQALIHEDLLGLFQSEWNLDHLPKQQSAKSIVGLWK